jgi:hypothetical protein
MEQIAGKQNETAGRTVEGEETFVLELRSRPQGMLEGNVLHLNTGIRHLITDWDEIRQVIDQALETGPDGRGTL